MLCSGSLLFVAACGDPELQQHSSPASDPSEHEPAPSTTVPVPIDDHGCTGRPVEVVERILIERRQGVTAPACVRAGAVAVAGSSCWTVCADGRTFVDFELDTTSAPEQRIGADGAPETVVPFAARYATGDGTTTAAASAVLRPSADGARWELVAVLDVDMVVTLATARSSAERFVDALRTGDHHTAASLMTGGADPPDLAAGRDDLGRLADDGFLVGTSTDAVADALAGWCASGASCDVVPTLELEVTAAHDVRVIATYELDGGTYEVAWHAADGRIEGLPIKVE